MNKAIAIIVKQGSQWCVKSEDGSKHFGCFPSEDAAAKRLKQIDYFKHLKGTDMNYEQAFQNLGKVVSTNGDPRDLGKAPEAKPSMVETLTLGERLRNGTIAGKVSRKILDHKDHFPVLTETQARSSFARAIQLSVLPVWYNGTLGELRKDVYDGVISFHPTLQNTLALSDGDTPADSTKIKDPADVVKTQVPGVKRPTLTSAELAQACETDEVRVTFASKLMDMISQKEADMAATKKIAQALVKKGVTPEQFDLLSGYLQQTVLQELMYSSMTSKADLNVRRIELINKLKEDDNATA